LSIRLHPTIYEWIKDHAGPGKEYKDFTHALERGIWALRLVERGELRPHAPPTPEEMGIPSRAPRKKAARSAAGRSVAAKK
jgi:hypothetical protein